MSAFLTLTSFKRTLRVKKDQIIGYEEFKDGLVKLFLSGGQILDLDQRESKELLEWAEKDGKLP